MPTYVFKCEKCGNVIEQLMTMSEYASTPAPLCMEEGCDAQQQMKPQLQAAAVIFKGSGWTPKHYKKD